MNYFHWKSLTLTVSNALLYTRRQSYCTNSQKYWSFFKNHFSEKWEFPNSIIYIQNIRQSKHAWWIASDRFISWQFYQLNGSYGGLTIRILQKVLQCLNKPSSFMVTIASVSWRFPEHLICGTNVQFSIRLYVVKCFLCL